VERLFSILASSLTLILLISFTALSGCANIEKASKSSTSLASFLGFSELPDWYVKNKYRYADSRWIDNDFNTAIHYRDVGEGPVVVLLHGEISSLHSWEKWIEILSEHFRVIAIDLPGSGLTSAPHCIDDREDTCAENLTSNYLAHTIEYFIEDLGIDKFSLVGSSYGGYLAAQYAGHQHPEKLDKLILITPVGFQQELPWILNYVTTSGMDILNRYFQPSTVITSIVNNFYGDPESISRSTTERYLHLAQSDGAHETNVRQLLFIRTLMEYGMLLDLGDINIPTLVMWGESDNWGDFSHAQRWQEELADATLVTYPLFGHALMEEGPKITAEDVVAFINEEPIPTIEGLGTGGSFSIDDAMSEFDESAMFGTEDDSEEADSEEMDNEEADTEEVETEAVDTEAVDTEAVDTEAVDTEAVDTEAVDTEAVDTEVVDSEVVETVTEEGFDSPDTEEGFDSPDTEEGFDSPEADEGFDSPDADEGFDSPEADEGFDSPEADEGFDSANSEEGFDSLEDE
jgi:pimeloyl-ACP methyl ester carboxylesterase